MNTLPAPEEKNWLLRVVFSRPRQVIAAQVLMCVMFVCNATTPVLAGAALDDAVSTQAVTRLGWWLVALSALFAVNIFAGWFSRSLFNRARLHIAHDLRMAMTERILDPRGLGGKKRTPGELLSVATTDAERVSEAVMGVVFPTAEAVSIIYVAIMMARVSGPLGIAIFLGGPLVTWASLKASRPLREASHDRQRALAKASGMAADIVQGLRTLKGLGASDTVKKRYRAVSGEVCERAITANRARAQLDATTKVLGSLYTAAVALAAGAFALRGAISVGELITLIGLTQFVITPMSMLGKGFASRWATARASGARVKKLLLAPAGYPAATGDTSPTAKAPTGITVSSRHVDAETLAKLHALPREKVLVNPHEADLFAGTVADNVHADRDVALDALRTAAADDLEPDRDVGDAGSRLSGGQKQRVALARAIAADADVLVLIDPTTSVDSVTEHAIAENVSRVRRGKPTVVFSQSPAWKAVQ